MRTSVVVFTRDLRVQDNPALHAACDEAEQVVPLFVLDTGILKLKFNRPNRATMLADSLKDLDRALKHRGAALITRRGQIHLEVAKLAEEVGAERVHIAADYSRYAVDREQRIRKALGNKELVTHHAHVTVAPGEITPSGGGAFSVFSPYHRRWVEHGLRPLLPDPRKIALPKGLARGELPLADDICKGTRSPDLIEGGETEARKRAKAWYDGAVADYDDGHDALDREGTSKLSPYLHFGCISPVELAHRADRRKAGVDAFLRQLAWRDFYHQVLAARPDATHNDWRTQGDRWHHDKNAYQAWQDGKTGYPLVDAGMRQLKQEGWMHNRARLVTGSFLTKHLYLDWRVGAQHFADLLLDADMANNWLNWQWIAGTGTDSRPNRMLNPTLQQERYDPDFAYVRKYVEEYGTDEYPEPIVDHKEAVAAFRAARGKD